VVGFFLIAVPSFEIAAFANYDDAKVIKIQTYQVYRT
jgi:hypothetical protein